MWFLIRAAFWLSIVFASLPWPQDAGVTLVALWSRARDAVGSAIGRARDAGATVCADSPLACLKAAAGLDRTGVDAVRAATSAAAAASKSAPPRAADPGAPRPPPHG